MDGVASEDESLLSCRLQYEKEEIERKQSSGYFKH